MSPRAARGAEIYLQRMCEACAKIREYVGNTNEVEFLNQKESYDAICLQMSQLGEQVSHLENCAERIIQHFPDDVRWFDAQMIWKFAVENIDETEQHLKKILMKRFGL